MYTRYGNTSYLPVKIRLYTITTRMTETLYWGINPLSAMILENRIVWDAGQVAQSTAKNSEVV